MQPVERYLPWNVPPLAFSFLKPGRCYSRGQLVGTLRLAYNRHADQKFLRIASFEDLQLEIERASSEHVSKSWLAAIGIHVSAGNYRCFRDLDERVKETMARVRKRARELELALGHIRQARGCFADLSHLPDHSVPEEILATLGHRWLERFSTADLEAEIVDAIEWVNSVLRPTPSNKRHQPDYERWRLGCDVAVILRDVGVPLRTHTSSTFHRVLQFAFNLAGTPDLTTYTKAIVRGFNDLRLSSSERLIPSARRRRSDRLIRKDSPPLRWFVRRGKSKQRSHLISPSTLHQT